MKLTDTIRYIKGVGPAREKLFNRLGIYAVKDLIYYFPRDYEDRTKLKHIIEINDGDKVAFEAEIYGNVTKVLTKSRLKIFKAIAKDSTGSVTLIWFNTDYIKNILRNGQQYIFYGQVSRTINGIEIRNPIFETKGSKNKIGRILPIYPSTLELSQNVIREAVKNVFDNIEGEFTDIIPESIRLDEDLSDINYAIYNIHFPSDIKSYKSARKRLAFEELLVFELGLMKLKEVSDTDTNGILFKKSEAVGKLIESLPFKLTSAQDKVLKDILIDMESNKPMRRLLQGDVGSGKTVIALASMLNAVKNGYQAALMVPTGILAEQHMTTFRTLLADECVKVELLSGSLTAKEKKKLKERIATGDVDVVIGTHAVIEDDVEFSNLGFIVTDEQHRFGVNQRGKLTGKGVNPDTLFMTATPIPRTLALILYGDLDISIIDELPPNRKRINTYVVDSTMEERINIFVEKELSKGRQIYVVCPMIEEIEDEKEDRNKLKNVTEIAAIYKKRFPNYNIGILHGRVKPCEKDEIMKQFKNKYIDVLISTTVIEVGVNVPNATVMIIENAERFGLAALHQLRGRVGRGDEKSYCILKCYNTSKAIKERMKIMTDTDDGFKIAEKDLELRGPGEFMGAKQHGLPEFKIANIFADSEILEQTIRTAKKIIKEDKQEYHELLAQVQEKFKDLVI